MPAITPAALDALSDRQLTNRDRAVYRVALTSLSTHEHKPLPLWFVTRRCFPLGHEVSKADVSRSLGRLVRGGYLERGPSGRHGRHSYLLRAIRAESSELSKLTTV